jgi:predicted O-methyltransferase YrrM
LDKKINKNMEIETTLESKILNVSNIELNSMDSSYINEYSNKLINYELDHNPYYFHMESGKEHYRLLMYVSTLYNNDVIFDVGTNKCMSALALSYNKSNRVKTYDIVKLLPENPNVDNIEYILGDSTKDLDLEKCPVIFLDVDHDGIYEDIFYDHLKSINWKGILILDDIHLNDPMKNFWNRIEEKKYDITNVGHWSGTGLVVFE